MSKKYDHLRKKSVELRQKGMRLGEICEHLALGKSTVYYWIKDIDIENKRRSKSQKESQRKATAANKKKHADLRKNAYDEAYKSAPELLKDEYFRDFVLIYMTEGYRLTRHQVAVGNSDENIVKLSHHFLKRLSSNKIGYQLQCHSDNDENALISYWADVLDIKASLIKIVIKSNSGKLSGRNWRSAKGVFTVRTNDTYLRSRMQAWMDYVQQEWQR